MCDKYGFVYIWFDRKHKRYYVGCHWGREDDGYICSSSWMKQAYNIRPQDFKRRIIKTNITDRSQIYVEEQKWLSMIKNDEIKPVNSKPRYYNLSLSSKNTWHKYPDKVLTIGQKISAAKKGKPAKPFSKERCENISKAKKGIKFSEEHKEKLRQAKLGRKLPEEHKAKIRQSVHIALQEGRGNFNVSNETRKRISESKRINRR